MNPFANMTPAMIDAHNARVAQRRADYSRGIPELDADGNPFPDHETSKRQPIPAPEIEKQGEERESKLHDQILAYCDSQWPKWKYSRARMDKRSTIAVGHHDITIFLTGGEVLCLECKAKGKKLTTEQQAWAKEMSMIGHQVYIVHSFADFESILRDVDPV